jgi:hypothetical protein
MYNAGYIFEPIFLEEYVTHAPFDHTGSGTQSNSNLALYRKGEEGARQYIETRFGPIHFSSYVFRAHLFDRIKREAWLALIHSFGLLKDIRRKYRLF